MQERRRTVIMVADITTGGFTAAIIMVGMVTGIIAMTGYGLLRKSSG